VPATGGRTMATEAAATAAAAAEKAVRQYTEGNRLDRSRELDELAQGLARCLVAVGAGGSGESSAKGPDRALHALHDRIAEGADLISQATVLTDQVQDIMSQARQRSLDDLNASTRRLREMFRDTDEKFARLSAFTEHVAAIQARMRVLRAAKDKKYPRHLKARRRLLLREDFCGGVDGCRVLLPRARQAARSRTMVLSSCGKVSLAHSLSLPSLRLRLLVVWIDLIGLRLVLAPCAS
jgi:hypothetical protein